MGEALCWAPLFSDFYFRRTPEHTGSWSLRNWDLGEGEGGSATNPGNRLWRPASRYGSTILWSSKLFVVVVVLLLWGFFLFCFVFLKPLGQSGIDRSSGVPPHWHYGEMPGSQHVRGLSIQSEEAVTALFQAHSEFPLVC